MAKVTLHSVRCYGKTEKDEDEIYCLVTTGNGANRHELVRFDVGNFEIGREIRPERLLWDGANAPEVMVTVMESDADEPAYGSDDFIGEVAVSADGNCRAGRATLDEGYDESRKYRQFSMTGSAANYVVRLGLAD